MRFYIITKSKYFIFSLFLTILVSCGKMHVTLESKESGLKISFVSSENGQWGIEVTGGTSMYMQQQNPVHLGLFRGEGNEIRLTSGYQKVKKTKNTIVATADLFDGNVRFEVKDSWSISGDVLYLKRTVNVNGTEQGSGFYSSVGLTTQPNVKWEDMNYFAPGLVYGKPNTNAGAVGGSMYYNAKFYSMREDYLAAPLFAISSSEGNWVGLLNLTRDGATTIEEATASANMSVIDERLRFGSLGARENPEGGVELSFRFPGTTDEFMGARSLGGTTTNSTMITRYRCHPIKDGVSHSYNVGFSFGKGNSYPEIERQAWRWAWESLAPEVEIVDVEIVRRTLIDHLADRVIIFEGRAGIPFVIDAQTGKPGSFQSTLRTSLSGIQSRGINHPDLPAIIDWAKKIGIDIDPNAYEIYLWPWAVFGFCGKQIEVAEQFLLESYRDNTARGQRFRELAEAIINTLVKYMPMSPPIGNGLDLRTGKISNIHGGDIFDLRSVPEDLSMLMDLLRRERKHGNEHPDWFNWAKAFADWLLTQQRPDGSFPSSWNNGKVVEPVSGAKSYSAVPLLVKMSEDTGDRKYLEAAIRAADYIWDNYGSQGVYLGATGSVNVADKESGMLALDGFLFLYENTKNPKWLEYAKAAGDYTESWIWIWNVPMPIGANPADLGWKPGVPTIGVNGIGSNDIGGVDQYLDWAVPLYAKLYKYTDDTHYLDVAHVLLHGTKSMLALPGRTYDLAGPGWQQEHWKMGILRGVGVHRTWLAWVSINHLHGITGLEEFDVELFKKLSKK